jgi:hypothetical protein
MKRLLSTAVAMTTLLFAAASWASHDYPTQIRDRLKLGYCPDCTLCHATPECGDGTVVTDFGLSLMGFGSKGSDPASLDRALDVDRARQWDSDGDGVPDIDELARGTDPSGPSLGRFAGAKYGCTVSSQGRGTSAAFFVIAIALGFLQAMRRRPHRARSNDTRMAQ